MIVRCLTLLLAVTARAFAGEEEHIHQVPLDHPTIQAAVDSAADGDTIEISAGTYTEAVVVVKKHDLIIRGKGKVIIDPPTEVGMKLDSCTGILVEKIRVVGAAPFGFWLVDSSDCTLSKCRVELSAEDAFRADGGSGHVFDKCTASKAGRDGIALGADELTQVNGCTITKCKLFTPGDDGVDVNGSDNVFEKCLTLKPFEDGYEVDDFALSSGNDFISCKVVKPVGVGLIASGNDNTFTACKVIQSQDDGADVVSGSGNSIVDCKLVKPQFDGIFEDDTAEGSTYSGNKITSPKNDDGLDVRGDGVTVTDNKVSKAGDNGYEIAGDGGAYTGNKSSGAVENGFDLAGVKNTLSTNKAKGSKGFDLFEHNPGDNEVAKDNIFGTEGP